MKPAIRKCKVCGKDYEYCHTLRRDGNIFRWQDVACCPEHGSQYFAEVAEARGEIKKDKEKKPKVSKPVVKSLTKEEK